MHTYASAQIWLCKDHLPFPLLLLLPPSLPPSFKWSTTKLLGGVRAWAGCVPQVERVLSQGHMVPSDKLVRNALKAFILNDYHAP